MNLEESGYVPDSILRTIPRGKRRMNFESVV